jgi:hypothetical protein
MPEETEAQRAERHTSMQGVRVTLPDGKVLETDDGGAPVGFVEPGELPLEPPAPAAG